MQIRSRHLPPSTQNKIIGAHRATPFGSGKTSRGEFCGVAFSEQFLTGISAFGTCQIAILGNVGSPHRLMV